MDLIESRPEGLYCAPGDFHIDPWRPVARAVITHAHADHARPGHGRYLAAQPCEAILRVRLPDATLDTVRYGERVVHHGVVISLHPAGHVLGSAQVRLGYRGETWVVSGDYKLQADPTCEAFEPLRCDAFVTESTFGLPIYRWPDPPLVAGQIARWWHDNAGAGRTSVLFCYALGKAQRIAAMLAAADALAIGPLACHGAMMALNDAFRATGIALPSIVHASALDRLALSRSLVLAPPSAAGTPWLRRFGEYAAAYASGWMQLKQARRRYGVERGFVLSDHVDWPGLQAAVAATAATRVRVTHGDAPVVARWLRERGLDADALATEFADEGEPATNPAGANAG